MIENLLKCQVRLSVLLEEHAHKMPEIERVKIEGGDSV
jgi:hypothetical protein